MITTSTESVARTPPLAPEEPDAPRHLKAPGDAALFKAPRIAWGTVALFIGILVAWSGGIAGGMLGWLSPAVAIALSFVSAFATFTVLHDASHHAVSRLRWLNSLIGHVCANILLVSFIPFQRVHLRHHRFTGDPERDPDAYTGEGPWWQLPFRWATSDVHYGFDFMRHDSLSKRDKLETWFSGAVLAAVVAGLCLSGHAIGFFVFWMLPAKFSLFCIAYTFDYAPHQRPHCRAARESPYRASFIIEGRVITVLLLCQNYHLVHHLYPAVPFYRYPLIWQASRAALLARGARIVSLFARTRPYAE